MLKPKRFIYKNTNSHLPQKKSSKEASYANSSETENLNAKDFIKDPKNFEATATTPPPKVQQHSKEKPPSNLELPETENLAPLENIQTQISAKISKASAPASLPATAASAQPTTKQELGPATKEELSLPKKPSQKTKTPPHHHEKTIKFVKETLSPEKLEQIYKLIDQLIEKINKNQQFKALFETALDPIPLEKDRLLYLTTIELNLLINTPQELFNIPLLQNILNRKHHGNFEDNINGVPTTIRYYIDTSRHLGKGGIGSVNICLYAPLPNPENEKEISTTSLKEGAIKIVHKEQSQSATKASQHEMETLAQIRELKDSSGLLTPIHIGTATSSLLNNPNSIQNHFTITKILNPLPGHHATSLSKESMAIDPAEKTLGYIANACKGLSKIHKMNRVHWDLKPGNMFLGYSDYDPEKDECVLGDLACPKITKKFLEDIQLYHGIEPEDTEKSTTIKFWPKNNYGQYEATVIFTPNPLNPQNPNSIPVTLEYMNRAGRHAKMMKAWANISTDLEPPPEIIALIDMGQMAKVIENIINIFKNNIQLFPSEEIQKKAIDELSKLMAQLDYIPEEINKLIKRSNTIIFNLTNPHILKDQKISFYYKLIQLDLELEKTMAKLLMNKQPITEKLMTAEKLQTELEKIANMIKSNRK